LSLTLYSVYVTVVQKGL